MSTQRVISEAVLIRQREASDPDISAWVSANAGSGKTHVLAQRVIRLLLDGVDPARILCITFTRAAAGNMANRVFDELRKWTALDDAELAKAMKNVGARDTGDKMRARARKLFALALETPGGLKVQTIHAFCTHILHLFPFEANVAARFSVLDEAQNAQLLEKMTNDVLLDAAGNPQSETGRALEYAIGAVADVTFRDLIGKTIAERDAVEAWLEFRRRTQRRSKRNCRARSILPSTTARKKYRPNSSVKAIIPQSEWAAIAAIGAYRQKDGSRPRRAFYRRFPASPARGKSTAISRFSAPKQPENARMSLPATSRSSTAACANGCTKSATGSGRLIERRRAVAARDRTIALVTIAKAVLDRFSAEKNRRGLLDFEDQIDKTHELLSRVSAAWVHYKLDRGIDHVLIDEAQDTSPKQWGIVRHLVAEFFAGKGASEQKRTIFAVGDEKQSIFSFQGAAPAEFESMRREFETLSGRSNQPFRHVRFDTSLRSGANVLSAVDIVFKPADVSTPASRMTSREFPNTSRWRAPRPVKSKYGTRKSRSTTAAKKIPGTRRSTSSPARSRRCGWRSVSQSPCATSWMKGSGPAASWCWSTGAAALFEAIIRALKNANIPVAGADRLVLTEHIAVMDLLVLADALLLPQDDLALATVLKSPLFGFDEDDIFALAHDRGVKSLRSVLGQKSTGQ